MRKDVPTPVMRVSFDLDEVLFYLRDAGVSEDVLESDAATGIIVRGVSDLWNYGSGGTDL